jgi:hypothetical protein
MKATPEAPADASQKKTACAIGVTADGLEA